MMIFVLQFPFYRLENSSVFRQNTSSKVLKFHFHTEWSVFVTTGAEDNMATENTVTLVVYGEKRTEAIELGSGTEDFFQKTQEDQFQVGFYFTWIIRA